MKPVAAPVCPRCNRNDDVRKIMEDPSVPGTGTPVRDGYMLEGIVIRPDSPDWFCGSCAERFGSARLNWGKFLSELKQ